MATSGSKTVSVATGLSIKFNWSQSSQSVANNTTTISWNVQVILASGYSISSSVSKSWEVTVNGTKYSGSNTLPSSGTKTMGSGTTTIGHNSDGTKTFSYSFSQELAITFSGTYIGTKSGSSTGTLDSIARASSVSCSTANIGSNATITITRASSSFTHKLTYSFGSLSGTIVDNAGTSYTWTIPTSFYAQIPNAKSGKGTITCTTYNGSTSIGSKTCSFTVNVSSASAPSLSVSIVDTDSTTIALTGSSSKLIRYYSDAKVTLTASGKNSATIKSYSISGGGGSSTSSSATINNITNNTFTCKTTDSRGYTTTVTSTPSMVSYVKLTCVSDDRKPSADGYMTVSCSGKYFNGSFGATSNSLTVSFRYKVSGGSYSGWQIMNNNISGNTYTSTWELSGLDYKKTYVFQFKAVDKLATVTTGESSSKSLPVFDWGETDFNFNVETNWNFGVDITATTSDGHRRVAFTPCSSAGNTTIGYGSYDEKQGYMNVYGNNIQLISNEQIIVQSPKFESLIVKRTGSTNGASVGFSNNNGVLGYIGTATKDGQLIRYSADTTKKYSIIDSTGGTISGTLTVNGTNVSSDERYKYIIQDIDNGECYALIKDIDLYGYATLSKRIDEYADATEISEELQESSNSDTNIHMGLMAQDLEGTELAKYILVKEEVEDEDGKPTGEYKYAIDDYAYATAIHGALKHEIELRDRQIEELKQEIAELKRLLTQDK